MKTLTMILAMGLATTAWAQAPTTKPTTKPANPDLMLKQLLSPNRPQKVIQPVEFPPLEKYDQTSKTAVAPKAEILNLVREGTFMVNRMGRLTKTADGPFYEFTFEADGAAMKDPPMFILPNLKLTQMESAVKTTSRDLKFLVTGMVTEYGARNYILLEKVVVVQDAGSLLPSKKQQRSEDSQQQRP
jgi:hypothetical protein